MPCLLRGCLYLELYVRKKLKTNGLDRAQDKKSSEVAKCPAINWFCSST